MKPQNITNQAFEEAYEKLNLAQKEAVDTIEGPVVVIAGPGTGKTQVLSLRIANILQKAGAGVGPENILALTFTNAGVMAMRKRLAELTSPLVAHTVPIFTFHSFAEEQIQKYPEYFLGNALFRPATDIERLQIIEKILQDEPFEKLKTFGSEKHATKAVLGALDTIKQEGITEEDFDQRITEQEKSVADSEDSYYKRSGKGYQKGDLKPDVFKHVEKNKELSVVYKKYQLKLCAQKLYDFNDMLLSCIRALEEHSALQAELAEKHQYILVDEHQDTNGAQNRILELLMDADPQSSPNIFTVGDDKQAIYRFQGASIENFLTFAERFEDTKIIHLTDNYRSSQPLLDAAHSLITHNTSQGREHVPLVAASTINHENLAAHTFDSYQDELWFLVDDVAKKIESGTAPQEIAIIYIENKFLEGIQEVLEKKGIAYTVSSKHSLFGDPVMKKLIILLHAAAEPLANEILGEALLLDVLGLDPFDVILLFDEVRHGKKRKSLIGLMKQASTSQTPFQNRDSLEKTAEFFLQYHAKGSNLPFTEFFDAFLRESGFLQYVLTLPGQARHLEQIATLLGEIRKNIEQKPAYRLVDFLRYTKTLIEYDVTLETKSKRGESTGVQLMTAHGSKGLEFEHVYITNFIHGRWNHKRRSSQFKLPVVTSFADLEDERRLFYVALTRGKKNVTLLSSKRNTEGKEQLPSLFLAELAEEHLALHPNSKVAVAPETLFGERKVFLPKLTDLEFIRERFLATKLSATALNNYFRSPLLYFFRNLVRLPSSQTKTLLYGNVVHKTLELFFAEAKQKEVLPNKEHLLTIFQKVLDGEYLLHEHYKEFETRGIKNLSAYYEERKKDFVLTLDTEKKMSGVTFILPTGEELLLTGIVDKIEYLPGGTVRVIDYKTGKPWSEKTKDERTRLVRQIQFYKLLLDSHEENGERLVMTEGVLDFVEPNKKGVFEQERIIVTSEDIMILKEEIAAFAEDILSGKFLEADFSLDPEAKELLGFIQVFGSPGGQL
jgi:DNA helicase-2/ATP-dependent DNA helicase PcrA